jgi:radical SAM superfamily enzyme YgiQ (UPF0313 family)
MNALIIAPRNPISGDSADFGYMFPTSLGFISAALKWDGHNVDCLNLNHYNGRIEDLVKRKISGSKTKYGMVCTGGLSTAYVSVKRIVESVRAVSDAEVVLGGGLVSSEPELMANAIKPDCIVIGEGDETIRELAGDWANRANIDGIGYMREGKFVMNKPRHPIEDLDALPWPDLDGLGFETYLDHLKPTSMSFFDVHDKPKVYPINASRSCPYSCSFCYHPIGKKYRQRSIDSVMQELYSVVGKHQINLVAIYDELFSHDAKRLAEFCRQFRLLQRHTPWDLFWTCQLRVDGLDEDTVITMRDAGCKEVSLGFESYSRAVLDSLRKHIKPEQIDRAVQLLLKHNISIQGNFIFGDKAETLETARETLNYWKKNAHAGINLGYIAPYPGTALYFHCIERGIIKDRLDFIEHGMFGLVKMSDMPERDWKRLQAEVAVAEIRHAVSVVPSNVCKVSDDYNVLVRCPNCGEHTTYRNMELPFKGIFRLATRCRRCRRRFVLVSRLYKTWLLLLSALLRATPMPVTSWLFSLIGKVRGWAFAKTRSGRFNVEKLRKIFG